jgi:hypothetical protein
MVPCLDTIDRYNTVSQGTHIVRQLRARQSRTCPFRDSYRNFLKLGFIIRGSYAIIYAAVRFDLSVGWSKLLAGCNAQRRVTERSQIVRREKTSGDNAERDDLSEVKSPAFEMMEQRLEKMRRRASMSKLIFYIIALILVIFLILWFRSKGM